jgi:hypothetical protein
MVSRLQPDMIAMQSSQHEGTIRSLAAARASGYAVVFCSEANAMIRKLAGLPRVRHVFWQTAQPTCRFLVEMVKGFFSFAAEKAGGREGYWNREIDETAP